MTAPATIHHETDTATLSLISTLEFPTGDDLVQTTRWRTRAELDKHLEAGKTAAEQHLLQLIERRKTELHTGSTASGATSKVRRIRLPFHRFLGIGVFRNHDYDESKLVIGPVAIIVSLTPAGQVKWGTMKVSRNRDRVLLGIGGAKNAYWVGYGKQKPAT